MTRRILSLLSALAVVGLSAAPAAALDPVRTAASTTTAVPAVTAADRIMGRADAPVTVIEYASFTCSHCAHWTNDVLPQFKARYIDTGKVRLVFRDMPTAPAQVAATAAGIARCAAPDKFFDVAHALMRGQADAFEKGDARVWFTDAIAASGRNQAQIETCLADPAVSQALQAEVEGAVAAGVTGTPSFFVNGKRMADPSLETLSAAIDPLIRAR
ncbi:DsbA family protein [Brevundimonas naejangsanensis]|uniref:DsbA family protein n=1 Tax=Brevundimonas naejangsanensis TaxID=588932 RepID=A0A494RJG1_9CAUL|nr:DsbA family protein [Brevundimonas naejangsanensis]AYG94036.1 DsbA family protein [Brevundimonas naejangsanensis]